MKTLTLTSLLVLSATMPLLRQPPASSYGVNVSIRPEGATSGPYELLRTPRSVVVPHVCTVDVTDLTGKATFTGPKVVVNPGETMSRTRRIDGCDVDFTVTLSSDARRASWNVLLRRDGQWLTRQQSDTWLRPVVMQR